jgi:hypothetical protein
MSDAIASMGVVLERDGHAIASITSIQGIETTLETIDVTALDSPGNFREFIGTLFDAGELTLEGNFVAGDTNGQQGLLADHLSRTVQSFVLTFPTSITATWTFSALVTKFKAGDFKVDGLVAFTATLKVSGQPMLAVGASNGLTTPFFDISESAVIMPDPAGDVYDYLATVLTGVTSVTVTPTATTGVIKVNGSTVATGVPSSAITLGGAGSITTITITQTDTGKVAKAYTIRLFRAAS